ncbi:MAG: efflux RND transporter permease subunit, partial [Verrucomicrobiales bacterium]
DRIEALRELDVALRGGDGILGVYSIFDARSQQARGLLLPPLVPRPGAPEAAYTEARDAALAHPLVGGLMLSDDARVMLMVVTQAGDELSVAEIEPLYRQLREQIDGRLGGVGIETLITGIPALRAEIIRAVQRDNLRFSVFGGASAMLISMLLFRNWAAVFITSVAPLVGMILSIGMLGLAGVPMNVVNHVLPSLVMVIAFTDSVHLMAFFRMRRGSGDSRIAAVQAAVREVGPACFLTSVTTSVAFASLAMAQAEVIRDFGIACAAATLLNFVVVVTVVPLLASTFLGDRVGVLPGGVDGAHQRGMHRFLDPLAALVTRWPGRIAVLGFLVMGLCLLACLKLYPDFRYRENLPEGNDAYQALAKADEALGGAIPLRVLVESVGADPIASAPGLAALAAVDEMLGAEPGVGETLSLLDVLRSLPGGAGEGGDLVVAEKFLPLVPAGAKARLLGMGGSAALVSANVRDDGAAALEPVFDSINEKLIQIQREHPGFEMRLTGVTYVSGSVSLAMISELARSLFAAAVIILFIIIIALRSPAMGLISVLPNIFPLAATGALLVLVKMPIQYTSVMSFTICLGIAVDDTIHFLMRYRKLRSDGLESDPAVRQSLREVGAVLVTTTLIMVGSFLVLQVSELPMIRLFGVMCALALSWALVGDLICLPAMLAWWGRRRSGKNRPGEP